jgi:hypothetical protein
MKVSKELKQEYMKGLQELADRLEREEKKAGFHIEAGWYADKFCRDHDIYELLTICGGNAIILFALFGAKGNVLKFKECLKIIGEPDF